MAWNEPGNNGKDQDPWGNRGSGGSNQGPPDLDEALGKLVDKVNGLFGGSGGKRNSGGQEPAAPAPSGKLILVILAESLWFGQVWASIPSISKNVRWYCAWVNSWKQLSLACSGTRL